MSLRSRIANLFRNERLHREIDEELRSHIDEAIEQGRDPGKRGWLLDQCCVTGNGAATCG
jgi:hypothetical protein